MAEKGKSMMEKTKKPIMFSCKWNEIFYLIERLADTYRSVIHVWELSP